MDRNSTQRCSRCGLERPVQDFRPRSEAPHRLQAWCRPCKAAYDRQWYQRNRERHIKAVALINRQQRAANRAIVDVAKNVPCADCGRRYPPYVMDFDHVRGRKVINVSLMVGQAVSPRALLEEIAKCDAVCANCHRERTHRRQQYRGGQRPEATASAPAVDAVDDESPAEQLRLAFESRGCYRIKNTGAAVGGRA